MTIHLRSHAPLTWLALMAGCFAIVMLAVVAVRGSSIAGAAAPRDLLRVAGYEVPADLDDGHFSLNVASGSPAISEDEALSIASQYAGGLATGATSVSIQYALFTDNNRGTEGPDGALVRDFVDVPSVLVRFIGVAQPVFGGKGDGPSAQELNVVIDAQRGDYLEMFSFQ